MLAAEVSLNLSTMSESSDRRSPPLGRTEVLINDARKGPKLNQTPSGIVDLSAEVAPKLPAFRPKPDPIALLQELSNKQKERQPKSNLSNWKTVKHQLDEKLRVERAKGLEERKRMWEEEVGPEQADEEEEEAPFSEDELDDEEEETKDEVESEESSQNTKDGVLESEESSQDTKEQEEEESESLNLRVSLEEESGPSITYSRNSQSPIQPTSFADIRDDDLDADKENRAPSEHSKEPVLPPTNEEDSDVSLNSSPPCPSVADTQPFPETYSLNLELPDSLSQLQEEGEEDPAEVSTLFEVPLTQDYGSKKKPEANVSFSQYDSLLFMCSAPFPSQSKSTEEETESGDEEEDFLGTKSQSKKRIITESDDDEEDSFPKVNEHEKDDNDVEENEEDKLDEEEEDEGDELVESEDEELAVLRDLEKAEETGMSLDKLQKKSRKLLNNYFEEEAELSGSDIGSDDDDAGSEDDELEMEEGDLDQEVGTEAELREEVGKLFMKQQMDEDKKKLLLYQEAYLEDGDLHSDNNQFRRFRWRAQGSAKTAGEEDGDEEEEDTVEAEEEMSEEQMKMRLERLKWKTELSEKKASGGDSDQEEEASGSLGSYFRVGSIQCTSRQTSTATESSSLEIFTEHDTNSISSRFLAKASLSLPNGFQKVSRVSGSEVDNFYQSEKFSEKKTTRKTQIQRGSHMYRGDSLINKDSSTLSSLAKSAALGARTMELQSNTHKTLFTRDYQKKKEPVQKAPPAKRPKLSSHSSVLDMLKE